MRRLLATCLLLGCGGTAATTERARGEATKPAQPADVEVADAKPANDEPAPTKPNPTKPDPAKPSPSSDASPHGLAGALVAPQEHDGLCVPMCLKRSMMRAVAAEQIERECNAECKAERTIPAACEKTADEARARVERVAMRKRSPLVWRELSSADIYCGYTDAFVVALAEAVSKDFAERSAALQRALLADPFASVTCPTGERFEQEDSAAAAIARCELDEPSSGWQHDVSAREYLAQRAARLRLEAIGATNGDHRVLLDTLLLSAGLAGEARK